MEPKSLGISDRAKTGAFFDLVVIAASAGGLEPMIRVLSCLPGNFGACVVTLLHMAPHRKSSLPEILARRTRLKVKQITGREAVRPGVVYVAPPDFHTLILEGGFVGLEESEPVNFTRPSADRLFISAAAWYGSRTIAVVLSGMGQDGRQGTVAIKKAGGVVIAQNQATAQYFGMPGAAIRAGQVDWILPIDQVPQAIIQLVETGVYQV